MFNIVLYEPEIPPNTGNILRLCANTGAHLHLIHPLAFDMDDKSLRRAGLDYIDHNIVHHYDNYQDYLNKNPDMNCYAISTKGTRQYDNCQYSPNDHLIFGPETRGLPDDIRNEFDKENVLRIPMLDNSRSINLANAVSIILFEAWRQNDFQSP